MLLISTWFQVIWFMAVLGSYSLQYVTLAFAVLTLVISVAMTDLPWGKVLVVIGIGVCVDFINTYTGVFEFTEAGFPLWLLALWVAFAWYAYFLTPILIRYPLIAVSIVGSAGGVLSYIAGSKLGAVELGLPISLTSLILAIEWALMIAIIIRVYGHEQTNGNRMLGLDK
nr:DUF2878 domain-containing protein [Vibrio sp. RE86]